MLFIFVDLSQRQKFLYGELFQNYDTHTHTHTLHSESDSRNLECVSTKIGEHNLKPLLTIHKESIDW